MRISQDNSTLLEECFKKLGNLTLEQWESLTKKYGKEKNRQD